MVMPAPPRELRIGTRGSQLALWQANTVAARIVETGGPSCRIVTIRTSGDRLQEAPLAEVGGKRLFVKEIEDALLRGDIDLAVHSSKDMPAILPEGLTIAAVLSREDPLDVIVLASTVRLKADTTYASGSAARGSVESESAERSAERGSIERGPAERESTERGSIERGSAERGSAERGSIDDRSPSHVVSGFPPSPGFGETRRSAERGGGSRTVDPTDVASFPTRTFATIDDLVLELGQSPVIGTGSVRRIAQLTRLFPGARFTPIRGNLDTRLRKLDDGEYDALVLAAAGLRRLGFASRISMALPPAACVPAPGQGIVAIEIREDDDDVRRVVTRIDDPSAAAALAAERALVAALGGGCQTPIGALALVLDDGRLELVATVVSLDGSRAIRRHGGGRLAGAASLGAQVAAGLMEDGAGEILDDARRHQSSADNRQSNIADVRAVAMTDD
jgi:porphobilinogen deaminase